MFNLKSLKFRFIQLSVVVLFLCVSYLSAYERSELMDPKINMGFRISNSAAVLKAIKDSPFGKLWASPEMKPFLNNQSLEEVLIKSTFFAQGRPLKEEEAVNLYREILSLFKGEVIAGFEFGKIAKDLKYFVLAEMDEANYKKVRELFKQEHNLTGKKAIYHLHTFQGVELAQTITRLKKGEKSDWMAFYGNTFINGSSRQWVEKCIVGLKKELPQKPVGIPSFYVWFPDGFIDQVMRLGQEKEILVAGDAQEVQSPDSSAFLKALGFAGIGKLALEWTITPSCFEVNLAVQKKGGSRGLWTLFSSDPLPGKHFLGYVPANILSYQVLRVNVFAFWKQIPDMLATFDPRAAAQFQAGLNYASQVLQVDVSRDIFANLDTVLTYYSQVEGIKSVSLYIWQLRNTRAMERTLGKLFAEGSWLRLMLRENFETLNLQDHRVYSFKIPRFSPPVEGKDPPNSPSIKFTSIGITVVDGDLVFGPSSLVRSYIHGSQNRRSAREFYKSPLFTRMIRRVPDTVSGYGLSDITQWIEPGVNFLKTITQLSETLLSPSSTVKEKPGSPPGSTPLDDFFNNLKFAKLPPPDFLRSFFGPWVNYYQFNGKELVVRWELHNPRKK